MSEITLKEIVMDMYSRSSMQEKDYYFFTLLADENGAPYHSTQTHWVGFADEEHKVELREARLVAAEQFVKLHRDKLNEGCAIVENEQELIIFMLLGGNALVEKSLAELKLSDFLKPDATIQSGVAGFQSVAKMPETIFQRAPTKKQRIRILKRDKYRCKICGRSPKNNVDITLHLHHIRPWSERGLTHDGNLITLCHTCHEGLDPHYELSLFNLLEPDEIVGESYSSNTEFAKSVRNYREITFKWLPKEDT